MHTLHMDARSVVHCTHNLSNIRKWIERRAVPFLIHTPYCYLLHNTSISSFMLPLSLLLPPTLSLHTDVALPSSLFTSSIFTAGSSLDVASLDSCSRGTRNTILKLFHITWCMKQSRWGTSEINTLTRAMRERHAHLYNAQFL